MVQYGRLEEHPAWVMILVKVKILRKETKRKKKIKIQDVSKITLSTPRWTTSSSQSTLRPTLSSTPTRRATLSRSLSTLNLYSIYVLYSFFLRTSNSELWSCQLSSERETSPRSGPRSEVPSAALATTPGLCKYAYLETTTAIHICIISGHHTRYKHTQVDTRHHWENILTKLSRSQIRKNGASSLGHNSNSDQVATSFLSPVSEKIK